MAESPAMSREEDVPEPLSGATTTEAVPPEEVPVASTSKSQATLYRVGDHVYVGAPFSQREGGSPFMVCRIIALHPAKHPGEVSKVQVAYYLRRRDVTNRNLADFRVVFATFMTGLVPLSHVRSKCQVMFRDYLEDSEAFKRQDDCFVFNQLYDRFMHKPFDLIPTSQILNAPEDTLAYMRSNYEFACTEMGSANDLCDATRSCASCCAFAARDESVTCSTCSSTWHLGCLDPPLLRKPALGWRWNCIKCNMAAEEEDDSENETSVIANGENRTATRAEAAAAAAERKRLAPRASSSLRKGKARIAAPVQGEQDVSKWKMKDGWPYRYFGQHVRFATISDPHDSIYPRASTRIGTRFQALGIPGEPEETHVKKRPPPIKKGKHSRAPKEAPSLHKERGDDDACDVIWSSAVKNYDEAELDAYLETAKALPINGNNGTVDVLTYALSTLEKSSSVADALVNLEQSAPSDLPKYPSMATWTQTELNTFERNIGNWEDELSEFRHNLSKKTLPQIVHYYYREKGPTRQYLHSEDPLSKDKFGAVEPSGIEGEKGKFEAEVEIETDVDVDVQAVEETSIAGTPPPSTRRQKRSCAVCHVEQAAVWYKCPDGVGDPSFIKKQKTMCPSCAVQWRHYGNPTPALSPEELDARESRDGKKKRKAVATPLAFITRSASPALSDSGVSRNGSVTPPPIAGKSNNPFKPCVMCKRPEPKATNYRCTKCGLTVHTQCYGIPDNATKSGWMCDVCNPDTNEGTNEDKKPACSLCPPQAHASQQSSALEALKRTSESSWVHLFCGLWHHELAFRDTTLLDVVEGVGSVATSKFSQTCSVCQGTGTGACLRCECCPSWFHVSCAWQAAYRFCFELMPVKESRLDEMPTVRFKSEEGDMRPLVICKDHHWLLPRLFYDLGQKDKATGWSALLTFTHAYKGTDTKADFPLVWKARMAENDEQREDQDTDTHTEPDSFNDIYEIKPPFIRKPRKKRGKAGVASLEEADEPDSASLEMLPAVITKARELSARSVLQDALGPATAPTPGSVHVAPTVIANAKKAASRNGSPAVAKVTTAPKKRKRPLKKQTSDEEEEDNHLVSEDEVMPTASTSRARKTARVSIRSVSKADILESENPTVPPVPHFAKAPKALKVVAAELPTALAPAMANGLPVPAPVATTAEVPPHPNSGKTQAFFPTPTPPTLQSHARSASPAVRHSYSGWQAPAIAPTPSTYMAPVTLAPVQRSPTATSPVTQGKREYPVQHSSISPYSAAAYYPVAQHSFAAHHSYDSRQGWPSQEYPYVVRKASDFWSHQNGAHVASPIPSPASSSVPPSSASSGYYSFSNLNRQYPPPPPIVSGRRTSMDSMHSTSTTPFIPDERPTPPSVRSPQR